MRISDSTISRNYITTLGKGTDQLNRASLKVSSGREYQKASEAPSTAIKAMKLRRNLSRIDDYQSNIGEIKGILTERESAISEINDIIKEASVDLLQGRNGTYSADDRAAIAESLRSYQETIMRLANTTYCDEYVFGGSNEYEIPFTLDTDGNLLYQGQNVDTGTFPAEASYIDIGNGSAFNISCTGVYLLGCGVDSDGLPNNIYNLLGEIVTAFENNDLTNLDAFSEKLDKTAGDMAVKYTEIGAQSSFVKMIGDRLISMQSNSIERQTELEGADTAKAILEYEEQSMVYDATLAMGAKILTQTLLDYLK